MSNAPRLTNTFAAQPSRRARAVALAIDIARTAREPVEIAAIVTISVFKMAAIMAGSIGIVVAMIAAAGGFDF